MSEYQFTPGPWIAFTDVVNNHTNLVSVNERTRLVLSLPGRDKSDPDVMLASAAPEMYEALELILELRGEELGSTMLTPNAKYMTLKQYAEAALSKARGEMSVALS